MADIKDLVNLGTLRTAYYDHKANSMVRTTNSQKMVLFYTVECGLKFVLMKNRPRNLSDNDKYLLTHHELDKIIKVLSVPATIQRVPDVRTKKTPISTISIKYCHTAWRYGISLQKDDESKLIKWLQDVSSWLSDYIN